MMKNFNTKNKSTPLFLLLIGKVKNIIFRAESAMSRLVRMCLAQPGYVAKSCYFSFTVAQINV